MKIKELQDTIIGVLYVKKRNGVTGFYSAMQIVRSLMNNASSEEVVDILKYLEAKDLIKCIYQIEDVYIQITTYGSIHVEELIERQVLNDDYLVEVNKKVDLKAQTEAEIERPNKEKIIEKRKYIIDSLKKTKIKLGKAVNPEIYDLKLDIDIIMLELKKINPDKDVIKQKLNKLDYNNNIKSDIYYLYDNINLY